MLATKKHGWKVATVVSLAAICFLISGCKPPGPRALLKGEELVRTGKYDQAVEQLQAAIRLLPTNAQALNYLGLAYHGNNQPEQAQRSYRNALALDQNLAAAHYNLGCLYLEQNNLTGAVDELTSYTLVEPGSIDGWLRLGSAHLRAKHLDAAEKSFKTVLSLAARHPDALNGLGLVQVERRRPLDALSSFNAALQQQRNHEAALLNLAILAQQHLNNRGLALQKYRDYLELEPRPANWGEVKAITLKLEAQARNATDGSRSNLSFPAATRTNGAITQVPSGTESNTVIRSNLTSRSVHVDSFPGSSVATNFRPDRSATGMAARTEGPRMKPTNAQPPRVDLPVVTQPTQPTIKPPRELPAPTQTVQRVAERGKPTGAAVPVERPRQPQWRYADQAQPPNTGPMVAGREPAATARYGYLSPQPGRAGNRKVAQRYFDEGLRAQKGSRFDVAMAEYRKATRTDPSYFEAYYNLGLAAFQTQKWPEALMAYEYALALKPDSTDTRYNFALALKQANYPLDSVSELSTLLRARPNDARLHLTLANLYAQLAQARLARQHYTRVLQLEPRHPESARIRTWLATH